MSQAKQRVLEKGSIAFLSLFILIASLFIQAATHSKQAILFLVGVGLGYALLHALFGFTGAWRMLVRDRNSVGVRAQILLLIGSSILFFPILAGVFPEIKAVGAVAPMGYSVLIGAFLFGIGMQLGGGCGSGTLFTLGWGQIDMLITFIFFIIGATFATSHLDWWFALGDIGHYSLINDGDWLFGLIAQLVVLGILFLAMKKIEQSRHGAVKPITIKVDNGQFINRLLHGPWPISWGVISLALLGFATLLIAGHPWSITFAFGLWGAKIWTALGGDVTYWSFWQLGYPSRALDQSVLLDTTSVMNFGLLLGAALASTLASKFAPPINIKLSRLVTAIIGGLLLGYGARLAFGCNIGALLAGISSGSLHGWVWLVAAFIGSYLGTHLRVLIKLDKPWH